MTTKQKPSRLTIPLLSLIACVAVPLMGARGCSPSDPMPNVASDGTVLRGRHHSGSHHTPINAESDAGLSSRDCGGLIGVSCADDEYCNYPSDAFCGAADGTGTCEKKPEACTQEDDPVCGCNGVTYYNACAAAAAGVSVTYVGECAP